MREATDNDVFSDTFESKLDPIFRSDVDLEKKSRKERPKFMFNARDLGRGMMPPAWREKKENELRATNGRTGA